MIDNNGNPDPKRPRYTLAFEGFPPIAAEWYMRNIFIMIGGCLGGSVLYINGFEIVGWIGIGFGNVACLFNCCLDKFYRGYWLWK